MQAIPLIRTNRLTGFWGLLDAAGLPADRYREREGISPRSLEDPSLARTPGLGAARRDLA